MPARDTDSFFVALLPPLAVQEAITAIKHDLWQRFGSKGALNAPPHITLQPPFQWPQERVGELEQVLAEFAAGRSPVPVQLSNFATFAPRVIYVDVVRAPELMALQPELMAHLEAACAIVDPVAKGRPQFIPHVTVAFKDLPPEAFHAAWAEYQDRRFAAEFVVPALTLLRHSGQRWQMFAEYPLDRSSR
jgi:2'-5' RNA ligase